MTQTTVIKSVCAPASNKMSEVVGEGGLCSVLLSSLPIDLWFEVLSRLRVPDKQLVQLMCINKDFYSIITHLFIPRLAVSAPISGFIFNWQSCFIPPEFFEDLASRKKQLPGLHVRYSPLPCLEEEDYVIEYFHDYVSTCLDDDGDGYFKREFIATYSSLLPFKMESETDDFLGCFNGVILVNDSSSTSAHISYYLCNPATKQCITIPVNSTHLKKKKKPFVGLAFDPLDPLPHHFKIIRYTDQADDDDDEEEEKQLDVFFSATGKWVKHTVHLDDEIARSELIRHSVYLNGILYMLSMAKYFLCFDIGESYNSTDAKLKARAIKVPYTSSTRDELFGSSNGCLYYACYVKNDLLVWTLQVNNKASSWLPKYQVDVNELYNLDKGGMIFFDLFIIYAVDLSRETVHFGLSNHIWSYGIKTNKLNYNCILDAGSILHDENGFYPYSVCLVKLPDCFSTANKDITEPLPLVSPSCN